ncbi:hypothetical protein ACJJTC_006864 [Scirpophaga incertulas]
MLLKNLTAELTNTIKNEIGNFQQSLEFIGDQVASIEEIIKNQNYKIKQLENKNAELTNAKKNLELRISALEQRIEETDQKSLCTYVEIAGIPSVQNSEALNLTKNVAAKLNIDSNSIQGARQVTGRSEKSGYLLVELNSKNARDNWLSAAKSKQLTVGDVSPLSPIEKIEDKIYIRESLTRKMKTLLYEAKLRLKSPTGPFRFVWCKAGKLYAKKSENTREVVIIRSTKDIDDLLKF